MAATTVRVFLSWCHRDADAKTALLTRLLPALGLFTDLRVEWWEDSHLTCGEKFAPAILDRVAEADFGLLLVTTDYLVSPFIREHELSRFAGPGADRDALPVRLAPLPPFGSEIDLGGLSELTMFSLDGRAYTETTGPRRTRFGIELAASIRRRALNLNRYRAL
ncbi:TIR domain-containing protein [Saccharothrix xinjiangensis]|uniref:TIR domain-containing protein n=1 Tax=Saccharothrix xinjiangensis TaxID=204798 RepID=A0ABV9XZ71_9PSEU